MKNVKLWTFASQLKGSVHSLWKIIHMHHRNRLVSSKLFLSRNY